jgi:hypothetical protein
MLIKFDFNNMMERTLGKRGFTDAQLKAINHRSSNLQLIACAGSGKPMKGKK